MNKIDEIALRVAGAYEALSEIDDCARMDIGVDAMGPRKVLEQFIADVEKLAELNKDAEPVARICSGWQILFIGSNPIAELVRKHDLKIGDGLFTQPAPVSASEQKPVGEGYIRDGKIIAVKLKDVELVMRLPEGVTLESLYLHPAPIPEGYALVPIEPTDKMIRAMEDQWMKGSAMDQAKREYKSALAAARSE